ncbi:MAG: response regulator transcription factor [Anaerolineae bacterium]|nr:response regulator transcription factor [Anaerolineae bacterium]
MTIRLIVANQNPAVRTSFSLLAKVTPDADCVGIAQSGEEMLSLNKQQKPDIILLELFMLQEYASRLLTETPAVKLICIMNTMHSARTLSELLAMGAVGCICQDAPLTHIRDGVLAAFQNVPYQHEGNVLIGVPAPYNRFGLSERESAVLQALAEQSEAPMTTETGLYLSNILSKLGLDSVEEALEFARQQGFVP